jgi:hypothetical protein
MPGPIMTIKPFQNQNLYWVTETVLFVASGFEQGFACYNGGKSDQPFFVFLKIDLTNQEVALQTHRTFLGAACSNVSLRYVHNGQTMLAIAGTDRWGASPKEMFVTYIQYDTIPILDTKAFDYGTWLNSMQTNVIPKTIYNHVGQLSFYEIDPGNGALFGAAGKYHWKDGAGSMLYLIFRLMG